MHLRQHQPTAGLERAYRYLRLAAKRRKNPWSMRDCESQSNQKLLAGDLLQLMATLYPDPENYFDNAITAAGVTLLAAVALGTTTRDTLVRFTNYHPSFVSAISVNMQLNRLWVADQYDASVWLFPDGSVDPQKLDQHTMFACGEMWLPDVDDESIVLASSFYEKSQKGSAGQSC